MDRAKISDARLRKKMAETEIGDMTTSGIVMPKEKKLFVRRNWEKIECTKAEIAFNPRERLIDTKLASLKMLKAEGKLHFDDALEEARKPIPTTLFYVKIKCKNTGIVCEFEHPAKEEKDIDDLILGINQAEMVVEAMATQKVKEK